MSSHRHLSDTVFKQICISLTELADLLNAFFPYVKRMKFDQIVTKISLHHFHIKQCNKISLNYSFVVEHFFAARNQ